MAPTKMTALTRSFSFFVDAAFSKAATFKTRPIGQRCALSVLRYAFCDCGSGSGGNGGGGVGSSYGRGILSSRMILSS